MRVAIVNTLPIPSGEASVNRILSYGKGLVDNGALVSIISSATAVPDKGTIDGVSYICFGKDGNKIVSLLFALLHIIRTIRKEKYDAVILVSNSLLLIYPLWLVCKISNTKLLQEKSEYPFVLMKKGLLNQLFARYYVNTTYRIFDGLIVMTRTLMDFFEDKVRKDCRIIEMPMTVDVERFAIEKSINTAYGQYIAYCGNMSGNKDGVENLIEAFAKIEKKDSDIKLLLIGGANSSEELDCLKECVRSKGIERIVFYGRATREEIPVLLVNAKLLALARPSSLQSSGGFPTKLGEYLATGNPVVVTGVGDIPNYLNKDNSYLVEPDNNDAFADALLEALKDSDEAKERGAKGKELAMKVFNSKVQSKRLYEFLQTMV